MATETKQDDKLESYSVGVDIMDNIKNTLQVSNDLDADFDSRYYYNDRIDCSRNNHHGADFVAMDMAPMSCPAPTLRGYIKHDVLHFNIMESRYVNMNNKSEVNEYTKDGVVYLPTSKEFVHRIMVDMHKFGRAYHMSKYAHLKYAIDWDPKAEKLNGRNWGSNNLSARRNYQNAKNEYKQSTVHLNTILINSDLPKIKKLKNQLNKLAKHDDGLTSPEVKDSLSKAISYIQNALFLKRHLGYHKKLQKAQHKKLKHKVMYLYHTKKLSINKTAKDLGISTPKVANLLGATAYRI